MQFFLKSIPQDPRALLQYGENGCQNTRTSINDNQTITYVTIDGRIMRHLTTGSSHCESI